MECTLLIYKTTDPNRNDDNYKLYLFDGRFRFSMENNADDTDFFLAADEPAQPNQWYHVAGVYDGNAMKLFIDGRLVRQENVGSFTPYTGTADLIFGTNAFSTHSKGISWSNAVLDEVRIYNKALTPTEIAEIASPCAEPPVGDNTVTLRPDVQRISSGESVEIAIEIDGEDVYAAHVEMSFDPEYFGFLYPGVYGDFFKMDGRKPFNPIPIDRDAGRWVGAWSLKRPAEPVTGVGDFARQIKLKARHEMYGETTITCDAILTDSMGEPLGVQTVAATIRVDDGLHGGDNVVSGTVTLPDGTPVPGATVTISKDGKSYTVQTDENGAYRFEDLVDIEDGEKFLLRAENGDYAGKGEVSDLTDNAAEVPLVLLDDHFADLNRDGVVNMQDFTLMAGAYNTAEGDPNYDERADLKPDNRIDLSDLALLGSHWP